MLDMGIFFPTKPIKLKHTYFLKVVIEHCLQAEVFIAEVELLVGLLFVLHFTQVEDIHYTLWAFENPLTIGCTIARALSLLSIGNLRWQ